MAWFDNLPTIKKPHDVCGGTGLIEGEPCPFGCNGTGLVDLWTGQPDQTEYPLKYMLANLIEDNVFLSYKILECIDMDEYGELTDAQKDGVKVLLSCGRIDLNDGKAGKVRLWNWFGAESTTVANLTMLLS